MLIIEGQGLCIIRESYVEKATPFVMLERSEASQGGIDLFAILSHNRYSITPHHQILRPGLRDSRNDNAKTLFLVRSVLKGCVFCYNKSESNAGT